MGSKSRRHAARPLDLLYTLRENMRLSTAQICAMVAGILAIASLLVPAYPLLTLAVLLLALAFFV